MILPDDTRGRRIGKVERSCALFVPPTTEPAILAGSERVQVRRRSCYHVKEDHSFPAAALAPATPTTMTAGDIVKDPFLQDVLDTSAHAREQCMSLVDVAEANAISALQSPSQEVQLELSKQQKLLYSYLAQLRGLNRNAINGVRNTKQVTAEARQEIDRLHLQLQNLYYEERHLRGEIAACESYEYDLSL